MEHEKEFISVLEEVEKLKSLQSNLEKRLELISKKLCEKKDMFQKLSIKLIPIYEKSINNK